METKAEVDAPRCFSRADSWCRTPDDPWAPVNLAVLVTALGEDYAFWEGAEGNVEKIGGALEATARDLLEHLRRAGCRVAPHDAYAMLEGHPLLEWQFEDSGVIVRAEVEGPGLGEVMVTYPLAAGEYRLLSPRTPAEFRRLAWGPA